ncbi:MAG: hypothetical protein A3D94_22245 [Alphaproteobacteria bacterium RIFCSPHIGHO2_12_FULL_66_14]|jgi:hypothetical protein|nr:MAG: hypothetical protein A3D94_22245 [Alphaproteobacteria bacterium RIFCSPHIGHO2_12_FULL_66_14]
MKPMPADWHDRLVRAFRWHVWCFTALNLGLTAINIATGRPWWAMWPLLATGLALGLHYILFKAFTVDEQWVEERVQDLTLKSYDRSHIESIRERQERSDRSLEPCRDLDKRLI